MVNSLQISVRPVMVWRSCVATLLFLVCGASTCVYAQTALDPGKAAKVARAQSFQAKNDGGGSAGGTRLDENATNVYLDRNGGATPLSSGGGKCGAVLLGNVVTSKSVSGSKVEIINVVNGDIINTASCR